MSGPGTKASGGRDQRCLGGRAKECCPTAEGSAGSKVLAALQGIPPVADHPSCAHFMPQGSEGRRCCPRCRHSLPSSEGVCPGAGSMQRDQTSPKEVSTFQAPGSGPVPAIVSPRRPPAPGPATGAFPRPGRPPLAVVPDSVFGSDPPACPQLQKRFLNWPLELRVFARSPLSLRCCWAPSCWHCLSLQCSGQIRASAPSLTTPPERRPRPLSAGPAPFVPLRPLAAL